MKTLITQLTSYAILIASAVAAGGLLTIADVYPFANFSRKIYRYFTDDTKTVKSIETGLLDLRRSSEIILPKSIHPQGGDLYEYGSKFLLISNDGLIYLVDENGYERLAIEAPYNGQIEYAGHVQKLKAAGKKHNPLNLIRLRYNGILFIEDPRNASKNWLLISYVKWNDSEACYQNVVDYIALNSKSAPLHSISVKQDWRRIYASNPCLPIDNDGADIHGHMSGGKIARLNRDEILIANGDFEWDGVSLPPNPNLKSNIALSQDPSSDYGKVLRINLTSGHVRMVSRGNRNMQGITVTKAGDIWTAEHGPRGGDKLNLHYQDRNFGWPLRTYGTQYSGKAWPNALPFGRMDGFDPPGFAWLPSVAVSDIAFIDNFHSAWNGDLLLGSLKAASLFRVRLEGDRGAYAEQIYIGHRIRSVHMHSHGKIGLWTDSDRMIILSRSDTVSEVDTFLSSFSSTVQSESRVSNLKTAIEECANCHSFKFGSNVSAPSLHSIIGRKVASSNFAFYSSSLKNRSEQWTPDSLKEFLSNPSGFAENTSMPNPSLSEQTINDLISFLASLK